MWVRLVTDFHVIYGIIFRMQEASSLNAKLIFSKENEMFGRRIFFLEGWVGANVHLSEQVSLLFQNPHRCPIHFIVRFLDSSYNTVQI